MHRRFLRQLHAKDPHSKYDKKIRAAEEEWATEADRVRKGERQSMLSILESRGLVNAIAG